MISCSVDKQLILLTSEQSFELIFRSMFFISLGVVFFNLVQFYLPTAGKRARRLAAEKDSFRGGTSQTAAEFLSEIIYSNPTRRNVGFFLLK